MSVRFALHTLLAKANKFTTFDRHYGPLNLDGLFFILSGISWIFWYFLNPLMGFQRISAIFIIFTTSIFTANVAAADTEYDQAISQCSIEFPDLVFDYIARSACIEVADKALSSREAERSLEAKEAVARPCIAAQLSDLEEKLRNLAANIEISPPKNVDEAKNSIQMDLGIDAEISIPEDLITDKTIVAFLRPECETRFGYLVNIRLDENEHTRWLAVFAKDPPKGLTGFGADGYIEKFSIDFEEEARRSEFAARLAAEEMQKTVEGAQRDALVKDILALSNLKVKKVECYYGSCYDYSVTLDVENRSNSKIQGAEFAILASGGDQRECYSQSSGNVSVPYLNLLPHETREITFRSGYMGIANGPSTGNIWVCAQLVSVNLGD